MSSTGRHPGPRPRRRRGVAGRRGRHRAARRGEAWGLAALLTIQHARSRARFADGDLVLLRDQDRGLWDAAAIAEGERLIERAAPCAGPGPTSCRPRSRPCTRPGPAGRRRTGSRSPCSTTSWPATTRHPSYGSTRRSPMPTSSGRPTRSYRWSSWRAPLADYHLFHATRADLLTRLGRDDEAGAGQPPRARAHHERRRATAADHAAPQPPPRRRLVGGQLWAASTRGSTAARARRADRGRGDRERPAGRHLVVDEQDRRTGGDLGASPPRRRTAATRWAELDWPARGGTESSRIAQVPTTGICMTRDRPSARSRVSVGRVADSTTTIASGRVVHSGDQVLHHVHDRLRKTGRHRPVGGVLAEERAQRLAVAEVGEAGDRPSGLGALGDLALEVETEVGQRRGPHPARLDRDAGAGQPLARLGDGGLADRWSRGSGRRSCRSGRSRSRRRRRAARGGSASGTGRS